MRMQRIKSAAGSSNNSMVDKALDELHLLSWKTDMFNNKQHHQSAGKEVAKLVSELISTISQANAWRAQAHQNKKNSYL
jgi:hypothetical protein